MSDRNPHECALTPDAKRINWAGTPGWFLSDAAVAEVVGRIMRSNGWVQVVDGGITTTRTTPVPHN